MSVRVFLLTSLDQLLFFFYTHFLHNSGSLIAFISTLVRMLPLTRVQAAFWQCKK